MRDVRRSIRRVYGLGWCAAESGIEYMVGGVSTIPYGMSDEPDDGFTIRFSWRWVWSVWRCLDYTVLIA